MILYLNSILLLAFAAQSHANALKFAVCICGQTARWLPEYLVNGLLLANKEYTFTLFFNIQASSGAYSKGREFIPSIMVTKNESAALQYMHDLVRQAPNTNIGSLEYRKAEGLEHWVKVVHGPLDRLTQHNMVHGTPVSVNIMNMYHGQERCAGQIAEYEEAQRKLTPGQLTPWEFDYVISTREDSYFFTPLNLTALLPLMRPGPYAPPSAGKCDIALKNCLAFGGFNMRLQLMNRWTAHTLMGRRFETYNALRGGGWRPPEGKILSAHEQGMDKGADGWKPGNPEQFELLQATMYNVTSCPLPVALVPVTAARQISNTSVCFYNLEVNQCVPPSVAEEVTKQPTCEQVEKTFPAHG